MLLETGGRSERTLFIKGRVRFLRFDGQAINCSRDEHGFKEAQAFWSALSGMDLRRTISHGSRLMPDVILRGMNRCGKS